MKVLLVNPPYTNFEGMKKSAGNTMPLNLAYLAAYLKSKINCDIKIMDSEAEAMGYKEIEETIREYSPDIVGITTLTPPMKHVIKITQITKEINSKCKVVLGGVHPTAFPEMTLKETGADFAVIGEGEITLYEIAKSISDNSIKTEDIGGICWKKENGNIVKNKPRAYVENLDILPFPARELFDLSKYYSAPTKKVSDEPMATPILTSRGCAFKCVHCISNVLWGRKVRFRSSDNVVREIEEIVNKYNIREFNILDDTFTLKKDRLMEICRKIIEKNLKIFWICFSRVNTIDEEMADIMRKAGCRKISFGLESGSQKILDLMNKSATVEMGRKAVGAVRKHGIEAHASFMFGNLGETKETIRETIDFAKSLDIDNATFFITSPLPGTHLYDIAKEKGYINANTKWEEFAPLTNTKPILVQDNVSETELVFWQKKAFREFYLRPKYIWHKLKNVWSQGGFKTLYEGVRILFIILMRPNKTKKTKTLKSKAVSFFLSKIYVDKFSDLIKKSAILSIPYKIISQKMIDWEFPHHLFIETTNACNLKCKMCVRGMIPLKIGEMDFDLFKKILDESANYGSRNFCLHLFGDPLLSSNLVKMIKYIKFKNPKNTILLTTNGTLLTKEKAEEIIANNVDKIVISVHSADREKYKEVTGVDMLEKVEENIKSIIEIKKKHKKNTSRIYLRVVVPDKKGEDVKIFRKKWKNNPVTIDVRELHNYGGKIDSKLIKPTPTKRYPCYHLWFSPGIAWDGEVSICCDDLERQAVIGNIKKSSISEMWRSDILKKYREYHLNGEYHKIPVCKNCDIWKTYPDIFFKWQKNKTDK